MAYATMMVHVDPESSSDGRTRLALGLANQFETILIGAAAKAIPPVVVEGTVIEAQLSDEEYEALRSCLAREEGAFRRLTNGSRKPTDWRSGIEPPTDFVAREARAADLVIIGRDQLSVNLYHSLDPAGLILRVGRPVLTVPKGVESIDTKSVLVAWKDTREARRAVQDSLPFLHEAEKVFIAEVCEAGAEQESRARVLDVAHYLTHHRIKATVEIIQYSETSAAGELIRFAEDNRIDLMVAGAYGHSRLGEWIFGGVTRDLLKTSPICCLLSH